MTRVSSKSLTFMGLRTLATYFIAFLLKSMDVTEMIFGELPLLCSRIASWCPCNQGSFWAESEQTLFLCENGTDSSSASWEAEIFLLFSI